MNGITHKIGGLCAGAVVATFLPEMTVVKYEIVVAASVIGSLYPDIDEPNSTAGKKARLVSKTIKGVFGHRGIIHTPFNLIALLGLMYYFHLTYAPGLIKNVDYNTLPWMIYVMIGFGFGYFSHLFLDFITPQGIMLFFPFSKAKLHILDLRGKGRDILCSAIILSVTVIYLLVKYDVIGIVWKA